MDEYQKLLQRCVDEGAEVIVPRMPEEVRNAKFWLFQFYPAAQVWRYMAMMWKGTYIAQ